MSTSIEPTPPEQERLSGLRDKFHQLKREWKEATGHYSDMYRAAKHPAARAILEMGWDVVPLMICDQYSTNTHWFIQLNEITGEHPVKEEHRGRIPLMAKDWLDWWVARGRASDGRGANEVSGSGASPNGTPGQRGAHSDEQAPKPNDEQPRS